MSLPTTATTTASIPARYLDRIRAYHPELGLHERELERLQWIRDGLNNDIVVVDDRLVCRFPKQPWAQEMLQQEARAIELIRPRSELSVPRYERLAHDFASYLYLPGEPLTHVRLARLPRAARRDVLQGLGRYLRALHAVSAAEAEAAGLGLSAVCEHPLWWRELREQVRTTLYPLLPHLQRDLIEEHFAPLERGELELACDPVLIDGDLRPVHLLLDPASYRLTAKIDFGTAGVGDPAYDVAVLITYYGEGVLPELARVYPELERYLERARFYAGAFELQWALAGVTTHDFSWLLAHLGGVRDRAPLGAGPNAGPELADRPGEARPAGDAG